MVYSCIYLITKPKKIMTYIVLALYIISNIPMLIIGERGSTILAIIFTVLYVMYRNILEKQNKWITKKMIIGFALMVPIAIMMLGVYNYTRSNEDVPTHNPISLIVDFFYRQGVTYDVLNIGYGTLDKLPDREHKNYTFGGFVDYVKYNKISQIVFKTKAIPNGNNETMAVEGNSFSHAMSYISLSLIFVQSI